jgi:hypothetical protein
MTNFFGEEIWTLLEAKWSMQSISETRHPADFFVLASNHGIARESLESDEWRWTSRCGFEMIAWSKVNVSGAHIEDECKDRAAVGAWKASMANGWR